MQTIVVCDSRGWHLDVMLDHEDILVPFHSGATLHYVAMRAIDIIASHSPDVILIMAGINDITVLNRITRRVSLISTSTRINHAISGIASASPATKIVIGGIRDIKSGNNGKPYYITDDIPESVKRRKADLHKYYELV